MASQHRPIPLIEPPQDDFKPTASLPETPHKPAAGPPISLVRPDPAPRSSTAPSPATAFEGYFAPVHAEQRPHTSHNSRNRSPYSRTHLRSRSSGAALAAPPMTRAHSMPNPRIFPASLDSVSSSTASSPMRTPSRTHSPLRAAYEDHGKHAGKSLRQSYYDGQVPTIEEDSELDIRPRTSHSTPVNSYSSAAFSRSGSLRRRPASPLHSLATSQAHANAQGSIWIPASVIDSGAPFNPSVMSSASNSPSFGPSKYNESYPSLHSYASQSSFGSMPSTPTSARSRSPSISSLASLGTIEDEPDLESEAMENERIERLRLAVERQERIERGEEDEGGRRRSSFDQPRSFGRSSSRERKRWSVCGGERRADLDLETIWED